MAGGSGLGNSTEPQVLLFILVCDKAMLLLELRYMVLWIRTRKAQFMFSMAEPDSRLVGTVLLLIEMGNFDHGAVGTEDKVEGQIKSSPVQPIPAQPNLI